VRTLIAFVVAGMVLPSCGGDTDAPTLPPLPKGTTCTVWISRDAHDGQGRFTWANDAEKRPLGVHVDNGLRVRGTLVRAEDGWIVLRYAEPGGAIREAGIPAAAVFMVIAEPD